MFHVFLESNITSIVALVVAIVSGIFSIVATKRSSKPQMVQPYIQLLIQKVDTLNEHIRKAQARSIQSDITTEEGQIETILAVQENYLYKESVFLNERELFTECTSQYKKLKPLQEAIDLSNSYLVCINKYKDKLDQMNLEQFENAPYKDFHECAKAMNQFSQDMDDLMRDEKMATLKLIKRITLE